MALAPFFERVSSSVGRHVNADRETIAALLEHTVVEIDCGSAATTNDALIAEMFVNLAARLYPRLRITGDAAVVGSLRELAQQINPSIELDHPESTIRVAVGRDGGPATLTARVDGWVASLDEGPPRRSSDAANPYACAFGGAALANEVFRRVFLQAQPAGDVLGKVSLLDYSETGGLGEELPAVALEPTWLAGVGAVGGTVLWALSRHRSLSGALHLVDHERIELSNLQRYTLATMQDVGRLKVEVGQRALAATGLSVHAVERTLEDAFDDAGHRPPPVMCIATDSVASRRAAQAMLPRLVVNGWTSASGFGSSWHYFDDTKQPCLSCLYLPTGPAPSFAKMVGDSLGLEARRIVHLTVPGQVLTREDVAQIASHLGQPVEALLAWVQLPLQVVYRDVVCGSAVVPSVRGSRQHLEAVPLAPQSAMAGAMLAAELVKRAHPELSRRAQATALTACDEVLAGLPGGWLRPYAKDARCICTDPDFVEEYAALWPGRRR